MVGAVAKAKHVNKTAKIDAQNEPLEPIGVKPKKTNISVQLVALAWAPFWRDESGEATAAWE